MRRATVLILALILLAAAATTTGCGCSVGAGEGDKALDVDMGGTIVKGDFLSFKPVAYGGRALVIRNTASERPLAIGVGTPILNGDGSEAAGVVSAVTIAAGDEGTLRLDADLAPGVTYYLGEAQGGGKPTVRQLFICPSSSGGGGGGGYDIPDVQEPDLGE